MDDKSIEKEEDKNKNKDKSVLFNFFDLLSVGGLSFLKDVQEAQNDDAKFKEVLLNMLIAFLLVIFCLFIWFFFQKI